MVKANTTKIQTKLTLDSAPVEIISAGRTVKEMVNTALFLIETGENVLLSSACVSMDECGNNQIPVRIFFGADMRLSA